MSAAIGRLIQFIDYKGDSKYKFCKKTGLSNGFLDKNRNIGSDKCEIISEAYPDLNITWLITGKGEMCNTTNNEHRYNQVISGNNNNQMISGYNSNSQFLSEEIIKLKKENEKLRKQIDKLINRL